MSTHADADRLALSKLTGQLQSGATGTLSVGKGGLELSVYVHKGSILGATSADDETRLLRRLELQGALSAKVASKLSALVELDEPVMGQLLESVDYDLLADILTERFEDCLARFVAESSKPRFKKAKAVWPINVQPTVDPEPLLNRCIKTTERASRLPVDAELTLGNQPPVGPLATKAVEAVRSASGAVKVLHVLADLPIECMNGRILLADLVVAGVLKSTSLQAAEMGLQLGDIDSEPATEEVGEESQAPFPATSLHDWMGQSELVDSDELEAFADNESNRSAGSENSTMSDGEPILERVDVEVSDELTEDAVEIEEEEALAAGEAPSQKFSAPPLSEEDAGSKVEVANESLRAIAIAVDKVNGPGAGRSAVRLLVEGVPVKFQALFTNIAPSENGSIPIDDILDNLYTRPASEHRALLSQGLIDLIERGIEAVADDLPDEEFDTMYEVCAGYRQKLGL